jgi:hypothetical protein
MSDPEAEAIAAYWRFFEGTNSRDPVQVTNALNYPHVRISARGKPGIAWERAAHADKMTFDAMLETGWDHTVGAEPRVLHVSDDKVHIQGGWTRYNSVDEPIMSNEVCYIVTRVDDTWGMQSRFGTDSELFWGKPADGPPRPAVDFAANSAAAEAVVRAALTATGRDNQAAAAHFHYPHLMVFPGNIEIIESDSDMPEFLPAVPADHCQLAAIQVGATGANVMFSAAYGERLASGLLMVKVDNGRWGIKGTSVMETSLP